METNRPLVSIVMPTFNNAATIARAVESVIAQTYSRWELIVVDDGCVDDTPSVVRRYATTLGDQLRYARQPHGGASAARNLGSDLARGRFLAFLDADDEFLPRKLDRQVELFHRWPQLGMVFSDYAEMRVSGQIVQRALAERWGHRPPVPGGPIARELYVCDARLPDQMASRYLVSTITAMLDRTRIGGRLRFDIKQTYSEEWLFFLDVASRCRVGYVDEPLAVHHHRRGSVSRTCTMHNTRQQLRALRRIWRRYAPVATASRKELAGKLARCHRQFGFDSLRTGSRATAARHFAMALRYERGSSSLVDAVRALAACVRPRAEKRDGEATSVARREPVG